jgi:molybdenum cofactor synthesis domain-containing protein
LVSVELLAVGRELLIGKTVNSNAHWIGRKLARMGGMINRMITLTDSLDEISFALNETLKRKPDFVIIIGGLGPTPDDMTLQGVAKALERKMQINKPAIQMIKAHYREVLKRSITLTPSRRKMAILPEGATPLNNRIGTAPGVRLEQNGIVIFCLPGVPREMKSVFKNFAEKEIKRKMGKIYSTTIIIDLERVSESSFAPILEVIMKRYPKAYIKSHPKGLKKGISRIELDIVVSSHKKIEADETAENIASALTTKIIESRGTIMNKRILTSES